MFEVLGGGLCVAGLSHTSHPREVASGGMVQVLRPCSVLMVPFGTFLESSGEPRFHLHAATCSVRPQARRGCVGLSGRAGTPLPGAALALDLGLEADCVSEAEGWGLVPD